MYDESGNRPLSEETEGPVASRPCGKMLLPAAWDTVGVHTA